MSGRTAITLLALSAAVLGLSACESSQDKNKRLAKKVTKVVDLKPLRITSENKQVKVVQTVALSDQNGAAAVVVLRNGSGHDLGQVPILFNALGAGRKSVFKNDAPGIDPALSSTAIVPAKGEFAWVNDQVMPSGKPVSVVAQVGAAKAKVPASLPDVTFTPPKLSLDPVSGIEASGKVRNASKIDQVKLILYCVARRGKKIVAAGRGEIQRLPAGKTKNYHIFFIGNPKGARLTVAAPPTVTA